MASWTGTGMDGEGKGFKYAGTSQREVARMRSVLGPMCSLRRDLVCRPCSYLNTTLGVICWLQYGILFHLYNQAISLESDSIINNYSVVIFLSSLVLPTPPNQADDPKYILTHSYSRIKYPKSAV